MAAVAGDRFQRDAIALCGDPHPCPAVRRPGGQPQRPLVAVEAGKGQPVRLRYLRQSGPRLVSGGIHAKQLQPFHEPVEGQGARASHVFYFPGT